MAGVIEYKEGNNGLDIYNININSRNSSKNVTDAQNSYTRGLLTSMPAIQRNMPTIMKKEANTAAAAAERALRTMGRWNSKNGPRAAAEARVRYWTNKTPLGSPQWKLNALKNSRNALTPRKRIWPFGGKHRRTNKRRTNKRRTNKRRTNKRRHTKRNRN
jgi:hypothetical protein